MQNQIQLIAMDMDGTLLAPNPAHITEYTAQVLKQAQERGIFLTLATGRLIDDASFFLKDAGLDMGIIGLNGGCQTDRAFGEVKASFHLSLEVSQALYSLFVDKNLTFGIFCDQELYVHHADTLHPVSDHVWGTYMTRSGSRVQFYRNIFHDSILDHVSKFVVLDPCGENFLPALKNVILQQFPDLSISASWVDNIEINPPDVDKGKALSLMASHLGVPMSSVMAIGDNVNDEAMLRAAGVSVAMGNATSPVLQMCDFRTLPHTQDGVAAAVMSLALGIPQEGVIPLLR